MSEKIFCYNCNRATKGEEIKNWEGEGSRRGYTISKICSCGSSNFVYLEDCNKYEYLDIIKHLFDRECSNKEILEVIEDMQ